MVAVAKSCRLYDRDASANDFRRLLQADRRRLAAAPAHGRSGASAGGRTQKPWEGRRNLRGDVYVASIFAGSRGKGGTVRPRPPGNPSIVSSLFRDDHRLGFFRVEAVDRQTAGLQETQRSVDYLVGGTSDLHRIFCPKYSTGACKVR